MSVSYADAASIKVPTKPEETKLPSTEATCVTETALVSSERKDSAAKDLKKASKRSKALTPAPVPLKSVWGSTASLSAAPMVDEQKFPTPGQIPQAAASTAKNAKFGKSKKWIPITAKVVFSSPRNTPSSNGSGTAQKGKRKSKSPRKKSTSAGSDGETPAKKDDAQKVEGENDAASPEGASEVEDALSTSGEHSSQQALGLDGRPLPQDAPNGGYSQQKGYKKYSNGSYGNRGLAPQSVPHRHQVNGFYPPMVPPYLGNKPYRSMPNPYARNGSTGAVPMVGYLPTSGVRPMPGSMPYIPHHPQPLMGGIPYGAGMLMLIPPPLSPKQNPQQALTQQIDYYFSLDNLIRDLFLRKKMGTEGWVDLDLILNFKRVEIIINGLRNSIEEADEIVRDVKLDRAIVLAVHQCENLEIGYLNGKENYNVLATEMQLRVKYNFEQWLLPDKL